MRKAGLPGHSSSKRSEGWSGIPESNRRFHLGKVTYGHYTNPASHTWCETS